jgi:predicted ATPase/class 3 adenylate cyclase
MPENEAQQLQAAIAALESQRPTLGDAVVDAALRPLRDKLAALESRNPTAQQRKLATVLFADVSGFTALSETMDAEVVAGIMNDLWALVDAAITGHGGRIDKHIGDAVMALWGAEMAREDDPEMAVRGALAMQAAIDEFCTTHSVPLAMRVGVNTGPVLLGQVGSTAEFTAMGDAVNLASRLEHAAPAGGVLISHDTYRHIRGVFDVIVREPLTVKGKTEPVQTYLVQRAKPRAFRMATRGVEGIETRMIGREAELLSLQTAYQDAVLESETRVVTIIGEAGVGKSRLLYEFDNWVELRPEKVTYFKGRGTPNTRSVPYGVFHSLFAFRFNILDSDSAALALEKFQNGLAGYVEPDQAAVAGHWLGFDFSASPAVSRLLGGSGFAETARAYLTRYFRALLDEGPAVMLLEDIHWADDPSLDLVLHLTATIPAAPLLVVAVARPVFFERRPGWGEGEAAFERVSLKPLSRRACRALVSEILQRVDDIPDSLRDLIVDAAEGNPYFVEELVKMLIEQGVIERVTSDELRVTSEEAPNSSSRQTTGDVTQHSSLDTRWQVRAEKLEDIKVPPTLTGLLQARLDGLPRPEREALQRASVVGRLFWDDAVAELLETEREAVNPILTAVRQRELIFRREHSTFANAGEYIFKHALLRDVTYETVLLKYRAEFHDKVARWLEENAGERLNEYLTLIAEHYAQAGDGLKAAVLLEKAAGAEIATGNWSAARHTLQQALDLREAAGETESRAIAQSLIALGRSLRRLGENNAAESATERGLAGARAIGDRSLEAEAMAYLARLMTDLGRFDQAGELAEEALRLARNAGVDTIPAAVLFNASAVAWVRNESDMAEALANEYLEAARKRNETIMESRALNMLGNVASQRQHLPQAEKYYQSALDLARASGNLSLEAIALANLGYNAYSSDNYVAARDYALIALDKNRELGEKWNNMLNLAALTKAYLKLGDSSAARQVVMRDMLKLARSIEAPPLLVLIIHTSARILAVEGQLERSLALIGLIREHPLVPPNARIEIEEELAQIDLPLGKIEVGLAAGEALDFDTVVQEILEGKW